jgi:transcriptional regulator PpsR
MDASQGAPASFQLETAAFESLAPDTVGALITSASDVAVVLDRGGVVCDLAVSDPDLPRDVFDGWVGRRFIDTVTVESRPKVERLLAVGEGDPVSQPAQVNHPRPGADDLPVRYTATALSGDRLIAVGRDLSPLAAAQRRLLAAQRNADREFGRLRAAEARYRQYFRLSDEPVIFIAANDRIGESNAAAEALWSQLNRLAGRRATDIVMPEERDRFSEALTAARLGAGARIIDVNLGRLVVAPLRHEPGGIVVRLAGAPAPALTPEARIGRVIEAMPDAFVVTDGGLTILAANAAFISMTEVTASDRVIGSPLDAWLGRPGVDVSVIRAALSEAGTLRAFATVVQGELGQSVEVEVSAARVRDGDVDLVGLSIRNAAMPEPTIATRSAQQLADLVGRVPLREIVRETTDTIERMCIEAALELSGDNRASAAELLGLSRQSLYVKMRRYGIADAAEAPEE